MLNSGTRKFQDEKLKDQKIPGKSFLLFYPAPIHAIMGEVTVYHHDIVLCLLHYSPCTMSEGYILYKIPQTHVKSFKTVDATASGIHFPTPSKACI